MVTPSGKSHFFRRLSRHPAVLPTQIELVPEQELQYAPNAMLRGLQHLMVAPRGNAVTGDVSHA